MALTALAVYGAPSPTRPWSVDLTILVGGFSVLYAVAMISGLQDRMLRQRKQDPAKPAVQDKEAVVLRA